jgi:hypothetical protein
MVSQSALDPDIVDLLMCNYDEIHAACAEAQTEAVIEYDEICERVALMTAGHE